MERTGRRHCVEDATDEVPHRLRRARGLNFIEEGVPSVLLKRKVDVSALPELVRRPPSHEGDGATVLEATSRMICFVRTYQSAAVRMSVGGRFTSIWPCADSSAQPSQGIPARSMRSAIASMSVV